MAEMLECVYKTRKLMLWRWLQSLKATVCMHIYMLQNQTGHLIVRPFVAETCSDLLIIMHLFLTILKISIGNLIMN